MWLENIKTYSPNDAESLMLSHGRICKKKLTNSTNTSFFRLNLLIYSSVIFGGFKGGKLLPSLSVRATVSAVPVLCLASVISQRVPMGQGPEGTHLYIYINKCYKVFQVSN